MNSDDFFRAKALAQRDSQIKELEKQKADRKKMIDDQRDAVKILRSKGELTHDTEKKFTLAECRTLLKYRKGGPKPASLKKADIVDAYTQAPKRKPTKVWSRGEEAKLQELKNSEVELKDTALGVATNQMARAVTNNLGNLDSPTRRALAESLKDFDEMKVPNVI